MAKFTTKTKTNKDHELTKDEQAKASSELSVSNSVANQEIADQEETAILAEATEIGEELAKHSEFEEALSQSVEFKKEDNYKSIRMLGLLERFLTPEQLSRLPWPGSEKKDAELDAMRLPPNLRPNILLYDKVKTAGRGAASFYRSLVLATHAGKKANDEKLALVNQITEEKKTSPAVEDETLAINQMLSAIKTAAKIRIQLNKIRKLRNIEFLWVREDDEEPLPEGCDPTMSYIEGASPVRKSTKVLWFVNKTSQKREPQRISVGTFLRWKITDEMLDRGTATLTGVNGHSLMESPNQHIERDPVTGKTKLTRPKAQVTTPTVPTARDVKSWTDMVSNLDAIVSYLMGVSPAEEQTRYTEWKSSWNASPDETLWSGFRLKTMLDAIFSDNSLVDKARAYDNKRKAS